MLTLFFSPLILLTGYWFHTLNLDAVNIAFVIVWFITRALMGEEEAEKFKKEHKKRTEQRR